MAPTLFDKKPEPGDLIEIFRGTYQHWAVYIGDGFIIHLVPPTETAQAGSFSMMSVTCDTAMVKRRSCGRWWGMMKLRYGKAESRQVRQAVVVGVAAGVAAMIGVGVLAVAAAYFAGGSKEKKNKQ
ncbi:hypothetical protein ANANG_G00069580 [Anguilla anguilla]|uniref:LRAT domain-containing protein n=1 Tax=Anguilla anguilla TaxID=7936 RepID=A0A9D3S5X9_ANGAN|nr:hypothetical protein ANANG_G00069580 [Anguilla anguilla]